MPSKRSSRRGKKAAVPVAAPPPPPEPDMMDTSSPDDDLVNMDVGASSTPSPLAVPGKRSTRSPTTSPLTGDVKKARPAPASPQQHTSSEAAARPPPPPCPPPADTMAMQTIADEPSLPPPIAPPAGVNRRTAESPPRPATFAPIVHPPPSQSYSYVPPTSPLPQRPVSRPARDARQESDTFRPFTQAPTPSHKAPHKAPPPPPSSSSSFSRPTATQTNGQGQKRREGGALVVEYIDLALGRMEAEREEGHKGHVRSGDRDEWFWLMGMGVLLAGALALLVGVGCRPVGFTTLRR